MNYLPKWLVWIGSIVVLFLLLFITLNQAQIFNSSIKNVDEKHTITVTAEGKVTAVPDLAVISASVFTTASSANDARNQNDAKMNKVQAFLKSQGIADADITTSSYNLSPTYDYTNGKSVLTGYTATQTLTIKVRDLTKVGDIADGLTQNGINNIQDISYTFDNPDNFREQAREQALMKAAQNAAKLATAAGVSLGKLVTFSENNVGTPVPYPLGVGFGGAAKSEVVPTLQPGTQDITADVTVTYELK